ncbi:MAG: hypothetical protein ACN6PN_16360, partial [Sphingobacterium sp.]
SYLPNAKHKGKVILSALGQQLPFAFGTENGKGFKEMELGTVEVSQQVIGEPSTRVTLQATAIEGDMLPEIASLTLVPVQE